MPTFDSIQVTGNATVNQALNVLGNETISQNLNVMGSETVAQNLQVNGSESVAGTLNVTGMATGGSVSATYQLSAASQPTLPSGTLTLQQVRYYNPGAVNQPGLVLTGTDGVRYVIFVDVSSGTPSLAIQRA
ncbi:hypothetical protein J2Z69_003068 [Paenibacillus shirakamiensis]|uniref:Uncharacterized protein n=1 Tax=Paenibacillus shirakamiensis TaxID=1265935 RepID=A0ABS4JJX3_9BACL|nr:hypothetical protein [Paenibacillus shirakamiensis]MBP2002012.1 hypothetical protein [Paenibacillus shirakamiensis]